jgi:hypothetical protein
MIRRRLSGGERAQLRSGDVFVWEEAAHKGGLERWTDGRKWYVHLHTPDLAKKNLPETLKRSRGVIVSFPRHVLPPASNFLSARARSLSFSPLGHE